MADSLSVVLADFHMGLGGQAAYVLNLARGLVAAGHDVTVACAPESSLEENARAAGLAVFNECRFRHGFRPLEFWRESKRLESLAAERGAEIVHTHGSQDCWRVALARRRRRGGAPWRHVRTKHNSYRVRTHPANKWLYRSGLDRLVVVAEALKPLLGGILPPEKIDVLHAPVAETFFEPAGGAEFRRELGVGPEVPLVGAVARLVPDKGGADLLRAMALVKEKHPEAVTVFVGHGPERAGLEKLAGELGLAERARFLGPRTDVPAITAALNLSVLASTDCDASSTVIKEALASGCPVVATEIGGIREIVEDGRTGRIVPPGEPAKLAEAIGEALADPEAARSRAARGREIMRRSFCESAFIEGQLAIYRSVLAEDDR